MIPLKYLTNFDLLSYIFRVIIRRLKECQRRSALPLGSSKNTLSCFCFLFLFVSYKSILYFSVISKIHGIYFAIS